MTVWNYFLGGRTNHNDKEVFMKRMTGYLVMAMIAVALVMPAVAKATPKVEGEIEAVLKKHGDLYKARDLKGIMNLYAKGPEVMSIGS
jgi:preprotein translocase subunit SecG